MIVMASCNGADVKVDDDDKGDEWAALRRELAKLQELVAAEPHLSGFHASNVILVFNDCAQDESGS